MYSSLKGISVSGDLVVRMIDEFPVFAVAAACATGVTEVSDAEELRYKESDRIAKLCEELEKLGVIVKEMQDGFIIQGPATIRGGYVETHRDHRLGMALAVAGLISKQATKVVGAEIIDESFPEFIEIMQYLGATMQRCS
jgi:3-phosphoshikimate 1-carboxyvinyltransferase